MHTARLSLEEIFLELTEDDKETDKKEGEDK